MIDITESRRKECEEAISRAGHASPKGTWSLCACCKRRVKWEEIRWLKDDRGNIISTHDCVKAS